MFRKVHMRLGLRLFGQFQATWDGQPITFNASAARAVLAYLALDRDRSHPREQLAALLWPDMPQAAAYANLRQALARVRKALPDMPDAQTFLKITPQSLEFKRAAATIDVLRFEELLAASATHAHSDLAGCLVCAEHLTEATSLYRGELLQGLFLAQPFEEWLLLKREQLHQQALAAFHALAEQHLAAQRWADAAAAAQRQIELDRWREDAYRQHMRALAGSRDRAAALAVYQHCVQVLNDGLGIVPDEETIALAAAIRTQDSPTWRPPEASALRHPLPSPLTPLVGREEELTRIGSLLRNADTRLVTLVGVGGAGKTRLALAAAWALREAFADGVGWVSLAGISPAADSALQSDVLATAVGAALGLAFDSRRVPLDELRHTLAGHELLIVLDNCEHLPVAAFARELLVSAPRLRMLATSRAQLDLAGEVLLRLEGLPVPAASGDEPTRYAGVQLFLERAQQRSPNLGRSLADLTGVVRLCRLLSGLPLGIELAARWVGHYTCDEIASEIEADLDFLAIYGRDAADRHGSMRAALDYSWSMLREPERQALARLSVFRGAFDRAAAQAVALTPVTLLAALVDVSLLRQLGVGRYGFHELVRQLAAARLADRGEAEALAERHATYYLDLLAQQEPLLYGAGPQIAATVIRDAADDLRQAWSWAVAHGAWESLARSLPVLRQYTWIDGLFYENVARVAEAAEQISAQVAQGQATREQMALLGRLRGTEASFLERQEARTAAAARAAIASAEMAGDAVGEAYGYLQLSNATVPYIALLASRESPPAIGWLERAITLCRSTRDPLPHERRFATEVEADCLLKLSSIRIDLREYDEACMLGERALALIRMSGDRMQEARALNFSAMALENAGRYESAYERRMLMLELARANDSRLQQQLALNNLSCTLIYLGDYSAALEHAQAALHTSGEWMQNPYHATIHHTLSWAACRAGETELALTIARKAVAFAEVSNLSSNQILPLLALGDALYDLRCSEQAYTAYTAALGLGREQQTPQPVAVALTGIARCRLAQGAWADAQAAIDEVLQGLDILTLGSLWEPLRIAETCYRVLQASGDRRADEVLHDAAALLDQQANQIVDGKRRQVFREQVAAHCAILEAVAAQAA